MSTSFRQFRKSSTAQGRFKDLVADYQRFVAEQVTVDNPDFRVKARVMHSKLIYHDPFLTSTVKGINTAFYMPFEPDFHYLVGMWDLDHNGRFCRDGSGWGHHGRFLNNPPLKEGIDRGFGTTPYVNFDGRHFFAYMDNFSTLRLSSSNQFSITLTIYPVDISATDQTTKFRTILHKADTSWPDNTKAGQIDVGSVGNGYHLALIPDGKVRFTLAKDGVRYSVETLGGVITPSDPPFPYDITVTVNQLDKRTIPPELLADPGVPGSDPETELPYVPPTEAPRMEISVNNRFYQLYTNEHLSFVDDPIRRLRIGAVYNYPSTNATKGLWFKFKGGIQQLRIYRDYLLTFPEIDHLYQNKMSIRDMPYGSPALAGSILVFADAAAIVGAFDSVSFDPGGYELADNAFFANGFPGFDQLGFDPTGYDTLALTNQGTYQDGGYDPRGFSRQGFYAIPTSQS